MSLSAPATGLSGRVALAVVDSWNNSAGAYIAIQCASPMSRVNPDELPGSMAVLGLVIEQPNETVKHIGQRLEARFERARFSRSLAHTTLPRLAGKPRWVRRTHLHPGEERSLDRYEATPAGIRVFRGWMYDIPDNGKPAIGKPSLREAMYGRIEFARILDLPRLIEMARKEEEIGADLYADASKRLNLHLRRKTGPRDFERKIREVLLYVDPMHWAGRAARYREIADRLEDIQREVEAAGLEVSGG
jgi:hypothetical protein